MIRRLAIAPFVVGATVAALVATLVMPSPSSEAFWTVSTTGGSSAAVATSVQRVGAPAATVATQNDVTVSWPVATLGDGTAVDGYVVSRTNVDTGSTQAATSGCARIVAATSCVETDVPDGSWTYSIIARFGSWAGLASASSAVVIADTVAPTNALSLAAPTNASMSGSTVWFRGAVAGSFRVSNAVMDDRSGAGSSSSGAVNAAGWSHAASSVATPARGPFVSNAYSWTAGTTTQPDVGISGFDVAGNVAAATLLFRRDDVAPTGGAVSYANGTVRTPSGSASTTTVPVATAAVGDAASGVAIRTFWRRTAPLTGDSCGAFGVWSQFASTTATGQMTIDDASAPTGTCVQYRHLVVDAVGNVREELNANVVKVKPPYDSVVQGTSGLMRQYRFDGTGAVVADTAPSGQTFSGTASGSPATGQPGAIAGDSSASMYFDGNDDYVRTSRGGIGGQSFSIELWFNTTQRFGSGTQWYNGAGLVDAEVSGQTNDFGLALVDGRVAAGVGNPDTTIMSPARYADGQWHHVVMTRDRATGLVILYVDGVEVGRGTGGVQALSTPTSIDFGRLQTGINYYRGSLDEVAIYNRVMAPEDVLAHYANAL